MDSGQDGSGGAFSAGAGTGSGGTGSGGESSTGGSGDPCDLFDNDAPGQLEVLIINQRSTSIFLGSQQSGCAGRDAPFTLASENGNHIRWFPIECDFTCAELRDVGYPECYGLSCLHPIVVEVMSGESHSVPWNALVLKTRTMPGECIADVGGPMNAIVCDQARRMQPGTFTFGARAGTELDCSQSADPVSCNICLPSAASGCSHSPGNIGGEFLNAEVTVKLDESYGVTADAAGPRPDQDPGSIKPVEIVFTE